MSAVHEAQVRRRTFQGNDGGGGGWRFGEDLFASKVGK
jgi:hypothetical protein